MTNSILNEKFYYEYILNKAEICTKKFFNKVLKNSSQYVEFDDIKGDIVGLFLDTFIKCAEKFDDSFGSKFTTYLNTSLNGVFKNFCNEFFNNKKEEFCDGVNNFEYEDYYDRLEKEENLDRLEKLLFGFEIANYRDIFTDIEWFYLDKFLNPDKKIEVYIKKSLLKEKRNKVRFHYNFYTIAKVYNRPNNEPQKILKSLKQKILNIVNNNDI